MPVASRLVQVQQRRPAGRQRQRAVALTETAYDISNGTNNPGNVEMTTTDQGVSGACAPAACAATQIRKVNVMLTGRSANAVNTNLRVFRNSLQSQISLRGMAFVDEYRSSF